MSVAVAIVGIGAEGTVGLSARARAILASATFLAGGRRHLELIGPTSAETFAVGTNLGELADRLRRRGPEERCVVLASGDPLFFGIGRFLGEALGRDQIVVEPSLSSMQLAFARAGLSWHDARIASVHGRPLAETLVPLLGLPKIGLFTQDGTSPSQVAAFLVDRGLGDYRAWVAEDLGTETERSTSCGVAELIGRQFAPRNVLILERPGGVPLDRPPGIADEEFSAPQDGPRLLTHAEIRAVTLSRFRDLPDGPIWDVGAGLGGMSVELARAFPGREVVAIERDPTQLDYLRANRLRLGAFNLRILAGEAPEGLTGEPPPSGIFVGGSSGRLGAILDLAVGRLVQGGVLVANFVGLEHLTTCLERLRAEGWPSEVAQVQVSQGRLLGNLTTFVPLRPVWIVRGVHPGS